MSALYQYSPLSGKDEIRILNLHPGQLQDPIHVTLSHVTLTSTQFPTFEALSYTWGSPLSPPSIKVSDSTLAITANLFTALHYLRNESTPRMLWIDAICVNQQDLDERSQQVKRMSSIYTLATRVVAWVGEEENDSKLAISIMKTIGEKIVVHWPTYSMEPALEGSENAHWADVKGHTPMDVKQLNAITHLLGRSWFERIWIWQEIRLGPPSSILLCGRDEISWEVFSNAVFCLSLKHIAPGVIPKEPELSLYGPRRNNAFGLCNQTKSMSFVDIVKRMELCKCTDPRDRIYATLAMLVSPPRIEPNYRASVEEVYGATFFEVLRNDGNLSVLTLAEFQSDAKGVLPSWVPDWNQRRATRPFDFCEASAKSEPDFTFLDDGRLLKLTGLKVATAQHIRASNLTIISRRQQVASELVALLDWYTPYLQDGWSEKDYMAFCRTLAADRFSDRYYEPSSAFQSREGARTAVQELQDNPTVKVSEYSAALDRFISGTGPILRHRCFFITQEGYIGLGPAAMKAGDIIAMFLGCPSLMLIRPVKAKEEMYQVIGEAYCDGFMSGEALLGPLPPDMKLVSYANSPDRFMELWGYYDTKDLTLVEEDPRLGSHVPLPLGWRRSKKEEFDKLYFVNDQTGEKLLVDEKDPRLMATELQKRGVPLHSFVLI